MSKIHIIFEGRELTHSRFNEIEKYVLQYFCTLWEDIWKSIYALREKNPLLVKSEVCLAFIGADSLSRFREIITTGKEEKGNENRFREWFDNFVFNDRNGIYKRYRGEIDCDSSTAWELRNSLLHFYGLPSQNLVGFGTFDQATTKKFKALVSQRHSGKQIRVINPYHLIEAVLNGFLIPGEILKEMIEGNNDPEKETYARGIVKCYEIIQNEGSVYVPLEKK